MLIPGKLNLLPVVERVASLIFSTASCSRLVCTKSGVAEKGLILTEDRGQGLGDEVIAAHVHGHNDIELSDAEERNMIGTAELRISLHQ